MWCHALFLHQLSDLPPSWIDSSFSSNPGEARAIDNVSRILCFNSSVIIDPGIVKEICQGSIDIGKRDGERRQFRIETEIRDKQNEIWGG